MRTLWAAALVLLSGCWFRGDGGPMLTWPDFFDNGIDKTAVTRSSTKSYREKGEYYYPKRIASYKAVGKASWYGRAFHGRNTACGEVFDLWGYSAAHKTLPIPSFAKITNLRNNTSLIVRINDRGPFVKDRILDLSWAAARQLGMLDHGVELVEIDWLGFEHP